MQTLASQTPVLVLGYGPWGDPSDSNAPRFKSGALAEWIQIREEDGTVRKLGLAESVNGSRVDPMGTALLTISLTVKQNKGGHEVPKLTVTAMEPVKSR